jgi:hypothetical protein
MRQGSPASPRKDANLISQRLSDNLCLHHELHEYDQDEDSRRAYATNVLRSHDVFTFRKVLVAIERLGDLFPQRMDVWLVLLSWLFCLEGGLVINVCLSIGQ